MDEDHELLYCMDEDHDWLAELWVLVWGRPRFCGVGLCLMSGNRNRNSGRRSCAVCLGRAFFVRFVLGSICLVLDLA